MNNKNRVHRACLIPSAPTRLLTPRALAVWLCVATIAVAPGCTTMHSIDAPAAQESWAEIQKGDALELTLRDGRQVEFKFVERTGHAVIGRDASGTSLTVESTDIEYAKVERFSAGRSALLGVAVVSVGFAAAAADVGESLTDPLTP
ncbi:MAG TPA: hypothetical protein VKZ91_02165 [Woeseiaceae bacterium]|nr:hypothetical protein [Woeseiaceae bacterium]